MDERQRIAAIINSEAGKARPNAALKLALADDGISAETAISLLGTMPKEAAATSSNNVSSLEQRMQGLPEVGIDPNAGASPADAGQAGWAAARARLGR